MFSQVPLLPAFDVRETIAAVSFMTSGRILTTDWRRIAITFQNVGSNPIWIRPDTEAAVSQGLLLNSQDPPFILMFKDVGVLPTREWWAIADGMDSDLAIYETIYTPMHHGGPAI